MARISRYGRIYRTPSRFIHDVLLPVSESTDPFENPGIPWIPLSKHFERESKTQYLYRVRTSKQPTALYAVRDELDTIAKAQKNIPAAELIPDPENYDDATSAHGTPIKIRKDDPAATPLRRIMAVRASRQTQKGVKKSEVQIWRKARRSLLFTGVIHQAPDKINRKLAPLTAKKRTKDQITPEGITEAMETKRKAAKRTFGHSAFEEANAAVATSAIALCETKKPWEWSHALAAHHGGEDNKENISASPKDSNTNHMLVEHQIDKFALLVGKTFDLETETKLAVSPSGRITHCALKEKIKVSSPDNKASVEVSLSHKDVSGTLAADRIIEDMFSSSFGRFKTRSDGGKKRQKNKATTQSSPASASENHSLNSEDSTSIFNIR